MSLKDNLANLAHQTYRYLRIALWLALLVASIILYLYLHHPKTLPITRVQVVGAYTYVEQGMLEDLITPYAKTGFFSVKLIELQQSLLQLPWLEAVHVRRIWPDTLVITLTIRTPVANWGDKYLLDHNGVIFTPDKKINLPEGLPQFTGPRESAETILKSYKEMSAILAPLQLTLTKIQVSDRGTWVLTLGNGMILYLGREKLLERLQRFVNTYAQTIGNAAAQVVSVDLRYNNGLSIAWKKYAAGWKPSI
jgi:cell division protein FtsQ